MNKSIIIITILMICLSCYFVWNFFTQDTPEDVTEYTTLAPEPVGVINPGEKYIYFRLNDEEVRMRDVRTLPETENLGSGMFSLQSVDDTLQADYNIVFTELNFSFVIALLKEPLLETRMVMEADLLEKTGLTKEQLCKMNILVGVPFETNKFAAGDNLGLSFCPESAQL